LRNTEPPWLHIHGSDLLLDVLVVPRASQSRIMGEHDKRLKIQLTAPPVDNQANQALIRFLADILNVPKAHIALVGGATNKRKTVRLIDIPKNKVLMKLL
jgi:uncharacterized protein (TIGR00251 family)